MYSFLVHASPNDANPTALPDKARKITYTLMPSLGAAIESSRKIIPEINGGWFYLFPAQVKRPLISDFVDDHIAVLVFGHIFQNPSKTAAEHIKANDQIRSELFAGPPADTLTDMLLGTDSIVTKTLSGAGLQKILNAHISGSENHLQTLGFLVTIE